MPKARSAVITPPDLEGALCVGAPSSDWDDVDLKGSMRLPLRTIRAMEICQTCPARLECLRYAHEAGVTGVWGGRLFHGSRYTQMDRDDGIIAV